MQDVNLRSGFGKPWPLDTITKVEAVEEAATDGRLSLNPSAGELDWKEAEHTLKNLNIQTLHDDKEYKIFGLSKHHCNEQMYASYVYIFL